MILRFAVLTILSCLGFVGQAQSQGARSGEPWNGSWKLDVRRSSPVAAQPGVPQVYRFLIERTEGAAPRITWEIPELGEVVRGLADGNPMPVQRREPSPGLALGVKAEGPATLLYSVYKNNKVIGGGRMMLVDNGHAWVDVTWPGTREDLASELVYVKE